MPMTCGAKSLTICGTAVLHRTARVGTVSDLTTREHHLSSHEVLAVAGNRQRVADATVDDGQA